MAKVGMRRLIGRNGIGDSSSQLVATNFPVGNLQFSPNTQNQPRYEPKRLHPKRVPRCEMLVPATPDWFAGKDNPSRSTLPDIQVARLRWHAVGGSPDGHEEWSEGLTTIRATATNERERE